MFCTHFLQMVIHVLSFMLMLIFSGKDVGNRDFADMARSTIDFAISPAFLSDGMSLVSTWKVICFNMEGNMIWFISHYWFDMVYHTPYFCTVRWPNVDIAVSSLTTNYISI